MDNIFVKYPELKKHFNVKKGLFKGFSARFNNIPVSVHLTTTSLVGGERTYSTWVNANDRTKQVLINAYYDHCIRILEKYGLYGNADLLVFIRTTQSDVWFYYLDKFRIRYNFYINKLNFDYALTKNSYKVTKFVDKYGDVYGIRTYVKKKNGLITFTYSDNQVRTTVTLGYSNNLNRVATSFCEIKSLNEKQKEYLHEWLNKITIGV